MSINQNLIKLTFADFLVRSAYQMGKSPVLPLMAASLGADALFLGMIVSVSTMTGLGMKPLFGLLSDRWGRRFWIIGGTLIFTGMPFLYGSIENPKELMLLRLAHGLATAIYGSVTLAWVLDQGRKGCAERVGWFGIAKNGGYIVGPLAGASLLIVMEPVEVFTVIGLISILALIPVLMLPTEHKNDASAISWKKQISGSFKAGLGLPELWIAGGIHLGHGVMDLRYHEGGRECGQPCTVTGTVNAKMQMFALDVVIPAGNALELVITQTNDDYIPSPVSSGYVTVGTNQNSVLSLPIIDRGANDLFTPPVWYENNE